MARQRRSKEEVQRDIELQSKVCCICEERKPFSEFYNFKNKNDGKCYRCKACDSLARKKWQAKHSKRAWMSSKNRCLKFNYGINLEDYDNMLKSQNYSCAICGKHEVDNKVGGTRNYLSVDHNHSNGKLRGLLCNQCNRGLGMLGDTVDALSKALEYLKQYDEEQEQP